MFDCRYDMMSHELGVVKARLATTSHAQTHAEIESLEAQVICASEGGCIAICFMEEYTLFIVLLPGYSEALRSYVPIIPALSAFRATYTLSVYIKSYVYFYRPNTYFTGHLGRFQL